MALAPPGSENPSQAFLSGQAHGKALAVQHHAAKPPASPVNKPKPVKAPVQRQAAPVTLNSALAQAQALARGDTNSQVAAYQQQQKMLLQQGLDRAGQINAASQAAAKFLAGIGDQTGASYTSAAQALAGLAQGYSGDVRDTASSAAAQIQAQLAGLGAPADSAKTSTGQTSQPADLANVLYGLGGAIPGNLLVTSGQALAGAQRQLPAATLGYGQQQAAGTLAASQQQARDLIPQIEQLKAGQPRLVQQYLSSIQSQILQQQQAQALDQYRTSQIGISQQNANTAVTRANNAQANSDRSYQLALKRLNKTGGTGAQKASASLSKSFGYLVDSSGKPILQNGKKVMLPGAASKPTVTSQRWTAEALGAARYYHSTWKDKNGTTQKPLSWQQYLNAGLAKGIPASVLIKQGRRIYTQAEIHQGLIPGG